MVSRPPPYFLFSIVEAGRSDETSRALEQKREMVEQIKDMQRKVQNEQTGETENRIDRSVGYSVGPLKNK